MPQLKELVPDAEVLLGLDIESLAVMVLETIKDSSNIHPYNYALTLQDQYPHHLVGKVKTAVMEAWAWLEAECLVATSPFQQNGWQIVTRRAQTLLKFHPSKNLAQMVLLPKGFLHPRIAQQAYPHYLAGDFDTAVFQAFKEVECTVQEASKINNKIGVDLMYSAFKDGGGEGREAGPLTDTSLPSGQQKALGSLFAGAIGWIRNPVAHHRTTLTLEETAEILCFASFLLRTVDRLAERVDLEA